MAVLSVWSNVSAKSQIHPTVVGDRQIGKGVPNYCLPLQKVCRCFSVSLLSGTERKWNLSLHGSESIVKAAKLVCNRCTQLKTIGDTLLKEYNKNSRARCRLRGSGFYALATASSQGQLEALDCYFSKLHNGIDYQLRSGGNDCDTEETNLTSSMLEGKQMGIDTGSNHSKRKTTLDSLENYFGDLNTGEGMKNGTSSTSDQEFPKHPIKSSSSKFGGYAGNAKMTVELNSYEKLKVTGDEARRLMCDNENTKDLQAYDEAADFHLINLLVAINIGVFLFEIASPVGNSELEQLSLPIIYGAKINKLILTGEWWRLLTPMFLHSGLPHIALGCWLLLTFGPQVCRGYGPLTFILIYVLGGICGNLTSFIHTSELTVCGTGPVFAIIGAWLVYQIQNKQVLEKEPSDIMFRNAVIATALSCVLSNFGRVDDWTHLGAAVSGIIFGYLTCPTLQLFDNLSSSSKNSQKQQGIAILPQQADPWKSLLIFMISVLTLSCLVFVYGPQLELLKEDDFL